MAGPRAAFTLCLCTAAVEAAAGEQKKPNLLLLFPDQWRYDWDGFHTSPTGDIPLHLPVTKSLAERGVRFTQAYVPTPLCAPSRAALASGREYDHSGVPNNGQDYPLSNPTFYSLLRTAGYHTMTVGKDDLQKKTQLGFHTRYPGCSYCLDGDGLFQQAELGFSDGLRYAGKEDVVQQSHPHEMYGFWLRNQTVHTEEGKTTSAWDAHLACFGKDGSTCDSKTYTSKFYEDDFTAANAVTLLRRRPRDKPFFLHVSFPGPHPPFIVTAKMRASVSESRTWPEATDNPAHVTPGGVCKSWGQPAAERNRCNYAAELEHIDSLFKQILDEVEAQGEMNHTLVFVTSDHGEMLGDHGDVDKQKPWQGSISVPLIVAGPGLPGGQVVHRPVATLDLAGTFLDFAGAAPAPQMTTSSMRGLWEQGAGCSYRKHVSSGLNRFRLVVKDIGGISYKYICCKGKCPDPPSTAPEVSPSGFMEMLIDVNADPFDMHDLSRQKPGIVRELRKLLPTSGYAGNWAENCANIDVQHSNGSTLEDSEDEATRAIAFVV